MKFSTLRRRTKWMSKLLYLVLFRCVNLTSLDKPYDKYFSVGVHYK